MSEITYADVVIRAVTERYAGTGSSAVVLHPETVVRSLAQIEHWMRDSLLRRKTRLWCVECATTQKVVDAFSNRVCKLECGHRRPIHTMSESSYGDLLERAKGLKGMRRSRTGFVITQVEDAA